MRPGRNQYNSYVINNAKEVLNKIVGYMLTKNAWFGRRNKSLKKCRNYYKIFLDHSVSLKAEHVSSSTVSSSIATTDSDTY